VHNKEEQIYIKIRRKFKGHNNEIMIGGKKKGGKEVREGIGLCNYGIALEFLEFWPGETDVDLQRGRFCE
jgi:hypothetical protein